MNKVVIKVLRQAVRAKKGDPRIIYSFTSPVEFNASR